MKELKVENEKKLGIKYQNFPPKTKGKTHTHILIVKKQEPKQERKITLHIKSHKRFLIFNCNKL